MTDPRAKLFVLACSLSVAIAFSAVAQVPQELGEPQRTANLFLSHCVVDLMTGTFSDRSDLYEWSEDDVTKLAEKTGFDLTKREVWSLPDGVALLVVLKADIPILCEVASFGGTMNDAELVWTDIVQTPGLRSGEVNIRQPNSEGIVRRGSFATMRATNHGFVQITEHFIGKPELGRLTLIAVRVDTSPMSCEFFPEECG